MCFEGSLLTCKLKFPVKWRMKVTQSCPTVCDPVDYTVHGVLQARILEWVAFPFSRGSSQPRDWTQGSLLCCRQIFFLPAEPQGKPQNTGVGSLSLLQQIFPTQESNRVSWIAGKFLPPELSGKPWQQPRAKVVTAYVELSKGDIGEFTLK